jgi:hypothetical protein
MRRLMSKLEHKVMVATADRVIRSYVGTKSQHRPHHALEAPHGLRPPSPYHCAPSLTSPRDGQVSNQTEVSRDGGSRGAKELSIIDWRSNSSIFFTTWIASPLPFWTYFNILSSIQQRFSCGTDGIPVIQGVQGTDGIKSGFFCHVVC